MGKPEDGRTRPSMLPILVIALIVTLVVQALVAASEPNPDVRPSELELLVLQPEDEEALGVPHFVSWNEASTTYFSQWTNLSGAELDSVRSASLFEIPEGGVFITIVARLGTTETEAKAMLDREWETFAPDADEKQSAHTSWFLFHEQFRINEADPGIRFGLAGWRIGTVALTATIWGAPDAAFVLEVARLTHRRAAYAVEHGELEPLPGLSERQRADAELIMRELGHLEGHHSYSDSVREWMAMTHPDLDVGGQDCSAELAEFEGLTVKRDIEFWSLQPTPEFELELAGRTVRPAGRLYAVRVAEEYITAEGDREPPAMQRWHVAVLVDDVYLFYLCDE